MGRRPLLEAAVVAIAAVAPHAVSLASGFVLDDHGFVRENQSLRSFGGALRAFGSTLPPQEPERSLYRPLTNLSYAFDWMLSSGQPWLFHLTNLVLYAAVSLLVLAVARRIVDDAERSGAAEAGALVFALHPVHTEVVDGIAGRSELLALLFLLAAILALASPRRLVLVPLFAALATLSKESGAMIALVLPLYEIFIEKKDDARRSRWKAIALSFGAVTLCVIVRSRVVGHAGIQKPVLGGYPFATRFWTALAVHFEDLRVLAWPTPLDIDYYYLQRVGLRHAPTAKCILGVVCLFATLAAIVMLARSFRQTKDRLAGSVAFLLAFYLVTLLPTSQIVPIGALMGERFLFTPSVAFALVIGLGIHRLAARAPKIKRPLGIAFALVGGLFASMSFSRAREWHDDMTLYSVTASRISDARIFGNIALLFLERKSFAPAIPWLERALAIDPSNAKHWSWLGYCHAQRGDDDAAQLAFEQSSRLEPSVAVENDLGVLAVKAGRYKKAKRHYSRALAMSPGDPTATQNLGMVEAALAEAEAFVRDNRQTIEAGSDPTALLVLARACAVVNDRPCARDAYARAKAGGASVDPMLEKVSARPQP